MANFTTLPIWLRLISEAELVVEGIAEDLAAKVELWKSLSGVAARGGDSLQQHFRPQHFGNGAAVRFSRPGDWHSLSGIRRI